MIPFFINIISNVKTELLKQRRNIRNEVTRLVLEKYIILNFLFEDDDEELISKAGRQAL
jgi:hypothetical protein